MDKHFSIKIPNPCNEDWNKMSPNERGRFCNSCAKTVIDFTRMDTGEIRKFIFKNKGSSICGHIKQSQLDSINLQIPIQAIDNEMRFHKLFLYALFIAMGTSLFSCKMDDGRTKKIDSIEITNTIPKPMNSIIKKTCATVKDSINAPNTIQKKPQIIQKKMLIDGLMIIGDIDSSIEPKSFNFLNVDILPEFPNIPRNLTQIEKRKDFQKKMTKFVKENFAIEDTRELGLKGKIKILTSIEIDENGKVKILKIRSPHKVLDEHTRKVLLNLPIFKPAEYNRKRVPVSYMLPIFLNYDQKKATIN